MSAQLADEAERALLGWSSASAPEKTQRAQLLSDIAARDPAALASHVATLRALRGAETDLETMAALGKILVTVGAAKLGVRHNAGVAILGDEARRAILASLALLDTLIVMNHPTAKGWQDVYEPLDPDPLGIDPRGKAAGKGGFGVVFKMRRKADALVVALKFLDLTEVLQTYSRELVEPGLRARFRREGETLRALCLQGALPNLLPFVEWAENGDAAYLAAEWAEGGTLIDGRERGASPAQLRRWLLDALRGLDKVHRAGWVHRDIKPANILLATPDGPAWLGDFGTATRPDAESLTRIDSLEIKTGPYAPPTKAVGASSPAPWMDLYSWGVTAFEVLTGVRPTTAIRSARGLEPEVPKEWDAAIARCLSLDAGSSGVGAQEILDLLEEATVIVGSAGRA